MPEPNVPLDYATPGKGRRPLGRPGRLLAVAGFGWFGLMAFWAPIGFVFRGFADEPGSPMTAARALRNCAGIIAFGLPGLALAVAALRVGR